MSETTSTWTPPSGEPAEPRALALVLVTSLHEPHRSGELVWLPDRREATLGRGGDLQFARVRPTGSIATGPLADPHVSRDQLRFTAEPHLAVENLGRLPLRLHGQPVERIDLAPGDLLALGDRMLLLVQERDRTPGPSALVDPRSAAFPFGQADPDGWVGEGEAAWGVRSEIRFVADRTAHVLVTGESGVGKELVARAIHRASRRSRRALVCRSAATLPPSLVDAELFGNLANYPNPGTPGRAGLIGEADGGTLFLDEFGELPEDLQVRLLRVLDDGEYTRLGEARPRRSDLRLVAATNRDPDVLKHDVLARFTLRLALPGLDRRPEDVVLVANHLLGRFGSDNRRLVAPFLGEDGAPRISVDLAAQLVTRSWRTHVRELELLLWQSVRASRGSELGAVSERRTPPGRAAAVDPAALDPADIQAALDRHGGRQEPAWRELGLASRHVLARLVRKHNLAVRGRG